MSTRTEFALNVTDILVLCAFGISQPLFEVLSKNSSFFVTHRTSSLGICLVTIGLCFILPGLLVAVEAMVSLLGVTKLRLTHSFFVALLIAASVLPLTKGIPGLSGGQKLLAVISASLAGSFAYLKFRTRRFSLVFLLPAVLIFPLLFLFHSPVSRLLFHASHWEKEGHIVRNPVPIVMVIFDEFPLSSLLNEKNLIDAIHYPHFASLAAESIWYRNATSVSDGTLNAVPAILDGLYPRPELGLLPNADDHPRNLFTFLGKSYRMNVHESNTRLCPVELCTEEKRIPLSQRIEGLAGDLSVIFLYTLLPTDLTYRLPSISNSHKDFLETEVHPASHLATLDRYHELMEWTGRPAAFSAFVDSILPSNEPTLHFLHILLPHAPWQFLPSGKKFTFDDKIRGVFGPNEIGKDPDQWTSDLWPVTQAYQLHLLQVGFVDRLLGELVEHLRNVGLYESALVVIVADHGSSFRPGLSRRKPSPSNSPDILSVPLFIKLPQQTKGRIDDRNVETVDILPTIAELLNTKMTWKTEGQSFASSTLPEKPKKTFIVTSGEQFVVSANDYAGLDKVGYKINLFGPVEDKEWLFRVGSNHEIVGRLLSSFDKIGTSQFRCEIDRVNHYSNVNPKGNFLITRLDGTIFDRKESSLTPINLAIAINGLIQAVTTSFRERDSERFSALLPETSFRPGYNDVRVFITESSGGFVLHEVSKNIPPAYQWDSLVNFTTNGDGKLYQGLGWGRTEEDHTWTVARQAHLVFHFPAPKSSIMLSARFHPYLAPGKVSAQKVNVFFNRRLIKEFQTGDPGDQDLIVLVPYECFNDTGVSVITFEIPTAVAPASIGRGPDERLLGIALKWLKLSPVERLSRARPPRKTLG
jgi:chromate transport protein ChrA